MTVYSVCLCLWLLDSTLWVIPFDLPLTAINPSNPLRCPLVALLPGLACLSPTSLYCFSQLPNNRKPSSHQLNNIGFMQEQDLVKPYQAVSYHFAVPFIGDFVGVAERVRRVSSEDELRQALQPAEYRRYPCDDIRKIHVVCDIELTRTCDVHVPALLYGVPDRETGARPRLTIRGARGLLVSHRHLRVENIDVSQVEVPADNFMCALQADEHAALVIDNCGVIASGSGVRGLDNSLIHVQNSTLAGITAMCVNRESSIKLCENNKLRYYGEWSVQICTNPLERPTTYPFDEKNEIVLDHTLPFNIFTS